jgi:glycosyltransferase involved in cell wall biosynthesis
MIDNVINIAPYAWRLRHGFQRDRVAIVYLNNDPICNFAHALAARLAHIPMILHARGFSADTPAARWVLGAIDHCVAVSNAVKTQLMTLGLDGSRCTVVPEGLDLDRFYPRPPLPTLRSELGYDAVDQVITLVGGLIDWKGQDVLLDACPAIFESVPNAKVLLVGSAYGRNNDFADAIARRVQDASFNGRVQLVGAREDVPEILALSAAVVHASTSPEPFGRTFLEGMAMGRPVIASNEGGPREVVTDGVDGLLIAPRDPHGLAQAVIRLLRDRPFADAMAQRAAMTATHYSIARHTDAISRVIRDVYRNNQGIPAA